MTITWFGQSCFRIEGKDVSILIDPFDKEIGLKVPRTRDAIILVTHEHHDHNNTEDAEGFIIRGPGEYEKSGVQVVGIPSYHDNEQGTKRGLNTIFVLKVEDVKICHLGDLGQDKLTDEQIETIGEVDILMVPIGGRYTKDGKEEVHVGN